MRIVETAGFYYPDSAGGTEAYLCSLLKGLRARGIACVAAAPSRSNEASRYVHEGTEVFRYPVPGNWLRREVQGRAPPRHFGTFEEWLREQRADVYHQHSWTTACGLWHLKAAKQLGLKTVVTIHVPANVCLRGTMLHEGRSACDGVILAEKCGSCWLQSKRVPMGAARRMAALPIPLGPLVRLPRVGPLLNARELAANHKKQLQDMALAADRVVAVCDWLYDALLANGVAPAKLVLSRQGVAPRPRLQPVNSSNADRDVFRVGYLGRWDPVKGVHVLVEAFKRLPADTPIKLVICAVSGGREEHKYCDDVKRSAASDRRIQFHSAVPHEAVSTFLSAIDVLAIPSQWMETGPLVVLEAFATGTPVIGSDLGGIKELVSHDLNGLLVPWDDMNAWTTAICRVATDHALLVRLRQGIGAVRTMSDVTRDMETLYSELFKTNANAA
jgi:glycosyltransferase involved in cell wall biosynthesis